MTEYTDLVECRMCGYVFSEIDHGFVQLRYVAPLRECIEEETYLLCSTRCLHNWLK